MLGGAPVGFAPRLGDMRLLAALLVLLTALAVAVFLLRGKDEVPEIRAEERATSRAPIDDAQFAAWGGRGWLRERASLLNDSRLAAVEVLLPAKETLSPQLRHMLLGHRQLLGDHVRLLHEAEVATAVVRVQDKKDRVCLMTPEIGPQVHSLPLRSPLDAITLLDLVARVTGVDRDEKRAERRRRFEDAMWSAPHWDESPRVCAQVQASELSSKDFVESFAGVMRPVVIRNAALEWPAMTLWQDDAYLVERVGEEEVRVKFAVDGETFEGTEDVALWPGSEDAIPAGVRAQLESPDRVVVRPVDEGMSFRDFVDRDDGYVEYLAMSTYVEALLEDVNQGLFSFASFFELAMSPNLWMGHGDTSGKLHMDPYDNLLTVLRGVKHVTLYDPLANENLYEGHMREAFLGRDPETGKVIRKRLGDSTAMVMSPVDPKAPDLERYPRFANAKPYHCTVRPGDALFMPSFFWHEVDTEADERTGTSLAVNAWFKPIFDKDFPCASCRPYASRTYDAIFAPAPMNAAS